MHACLSETKQYTQERARDLAIERGEERPIVRKRVI